MRTLNWRVLKTYILHIIFTYFRCSIPKLCLKFASVNPQLFVDQAFLRKHRPKWRITLLPTLRPKMFNPFPEFPEYSGETLLSTEESGKKMVCKFGVVRCNMNKCIYPKTARAWRIFLHIYIYIIDVHCTFTVESTWKKHTFFLDISKWTWSPRRCTSEAKTAFGDGSVRKLCLMIRRMKWWQDAWGIGRKPWNKPYRILRILTWIFRHRSL